MQFSAGCVDFEGMVHEFTDVIVGETSRLEGMREPGALNEHYADMMAVVGDREAFDLNWTIGENRTGMPGTPVRDLQSPGIDHMRKKALLKAGEELDKDANDFEYVHANST